MHAYWSQAVPDVLSALGSSASGLTQADAEVRLKTGGENRVTAKEGATALRLLLRQYESPLVLILIFGALDLGRTPGMDRREHHPRHRARQHASRLRPGIPRHGGGEEPAR